MQVKRTTKRRVKSPAGIAAVELAVCLPVLVIVFFATIEACTMYYVQQRLKIAAYEGARVGIVPTAEASNVNFQCQTLLDDSGVNNYTISLSPSDPTSLSPGDFFIVTVEADYGSNSITGLFYDDKTLSRSVALRYD